MGVNKNIIVLLIVGVIVRLWLFRSEFLRTWLENRLEIATPLTSWNRILEGIYLNKKVGLSSYEGDLVHELPMMLSFYEIFTKNFINTSYIFIIFDILNAFLIYNIVKKSIQIFYVTEKRDGKAGKYRRLIESMDDTSLAKFFVHKNSFDYEFWSVVAFGVYLFNPFTIASCIAQSTVLVHNLFMLLWLFCLINGQATVAFFFLAIHANLSIYSGSLIVASIFYLYRSMPAKKMSFSMFAVKNALVFLVQVVLVFMFNLWLEDFNLRFVKCTYLFVLEVPDLVPNLGVFWYFFTEMFDHFRLFFTYVFQFNVLIYAIPISLRLRNDSIISIIIQIGLISTLKSYPSIGEIGMFVSLLPMAAYLFPLVRNFLIYSCMLVASVVLAPIMFYLWVGSGGGNANFYFAITLVYSIGLIFLIVDLFYAQLKRDFIKANGADIPKGKDGQLAGFHLE